MNQISVSGEFSPYIGVVIPVYNVRSYIESCVHSVLRQTYKKLEIILVDDGSTDGSSDLCDSLARSDDRISVIHQANAGLSSARNVGAQHCQSNLLMYVDSDDVISPNFVEYLVRPIISGCCEMTMCKGTPFYDEHELNFGKPYSEESLDSERALVELLSEKKASTAAWGKLVPKLMWLQFFFPVGRKFEDLPVTWKLLQGVHSVVIVGGAVYGYRKHENTISSSSSVSAILDYRESIRQVWVELQSNSSEVRRAKSFRCCLEYCRLIGMTEKVRESDKDSATSAQVREIEHDAVCFLQAHSAQAFLASHAAFIQRVRILMTAVFPIIASLNGVRRITKSNASM